MSYSGYKMIFMPEHPEADKRGFVAQHRYVAEQILGRPLKKGEVVHHINCQRTDTRPENILVFKSREDHSRYHAGGELMQDPSDPNVYISTFIRPEIPCAYCGTMFSPKNATAKYCCNECSSLSQRKVENRPSKRELKKLLLEFRISEISEIYGISGNGIRRWCQFYKLPYKLKDIKKLREKEQKKKEERALKQEMKERVKQRDKLKEYNSK